MRKKKKSVKKSKVPMPKSLKVGRNHSMEDITVLVPHSLREKVRKFCIKGGLGVSEGVEILLSVGLRHETESQKGLYLTIEEASKQVPRSVLEALTDMGRITPLEDNGKKQYPQRQVVRALRFYEKMAKHRTK